MCKTLYLPGMVIASWHGVAVYEDDGNGDFRRCNNWYWSTGYHQHYEVARHDSGSYWVPASTHPPHSWTRPVPIEGDQPVTRGGVNPSGSEYRPDGVYIWIPRVPGDYTPGQSNNCVACRPPLAPPNPAVTVSTAPSTALAQVHQQLDTILAQPDSDQLAAADGNSFQDSDGLISFVNLSTDLVTNNASYKIGTEVFDKMANFFSTLRVKVFTAMKNGEIKPLQSDSAPESQWDPAVTHYMEYLLQESGGLTNYSITQETYSETQYLVDFSTDFLKLLFDVTSVPNAIISGITKFVTGVGESLRHGWDDRTRNYSIALLGQCHEAVPEDGEESYRYFPKLKYYHLAVSASQSEFTTPCSKIQKITFDFAYEYYVTGVAAAVLDPTSNAYLRFNGMLEKAQAVNYKDADNKLDIILNGVTSTGPGTVNIFSANLANYPTISTTPRKRLTPA